MKEDVKASKAYRLKKYIDKLLPLTVLLLSVYLYIELFAATSSVIYAWKRPLKFFLLFYFVGELVLLFSMYEDDKKFFRNHWLDILLTVPFFTTLKGLSGIKLVKSTKIGKLLKPGKFMKNTKLVQKSAKLLKKSFKFIKKKL